MRYAKLNQTLIFITVLGVGNTVSASPLGTYFLTSASDGYITLIRGSLSASTAMANGSESPIAIIGSTARTLGYSVSTEGAEYVETGPLTLSDTGVSYPNNIDGSLFLDGASDGSFNYTVDYGKGQVFKFDNNWENPELAFDLADNGWEGITYDKSDQTLWVSNFVTGLVSHRSLTGNLLGGFDTGAELTYTALAIDRDGTLWLGTANDSSTLAQFSTNGTFLGSQVVAGLWNVYGGEIDLPEPASWSILLAGYGALWHRRKAKPQ